MKRNGDGSTGYGLLTGLTVIVHLEVDQKRG